MALDAQEIVIGGTGHVFVGNEGLALPAHLNAPVPGELTDLGYTTDDGGKFTDGKTTNDVRPWQSFYPVRVHITEREATLEFTLLQWNRATVELAFGGGEWTEPDPGVFRYTPPSPETLDVRCMLIDIADGDRNFRIGIPRGFVTSNTESTFAKTGPALLPITFTVLANDDGQPWTFDTDDPAFGTGGVS